MNYTKVYENITTDETWERGDVYHVDKKGNKTFITPYIKLLVTPWFLEPPACIFGIKTKETEEFYNFCAESQEPIYLLSYMKLLGEPYEKNIRIFNNILLPYVSENNIDLILFLKTKMNVARFSYFVEMYDSISKKHIKEIFYEYVTTDIMLTDILNYEKFQDMKLDNSVIDKFKTEYADKIKEAKTNNKLIGWLVGQMMKASGGKINPVEEKDFILKVIEE